MDFVFYPKHEHGCPHVGHCPHVGGAGLGALVLAANDRNQYVAMLHGQLDEERRRNTALYADNKKLREQLAQTQRELKAERQQRYCKDRPTIEKPAGPPAASGAGQKKRGAPPGHPGWFRPRPTTWDRCIDVPADGVIVLYTERSGRTSGRIHR